MGRQYVGLAKHLKDAVEAVLGEKIELEVPEVSEHGDYSTNVALRSNKNPREEAANLVKKLQADDKVSKLVDKIEVAGPGFINFWLSPAALWENLAEILKKNDKFGGSDVLKGQKIMFEYGQPNTHKLPHIGHLFSYILGSTMSNLLEFTGASVRRVNYQGDVGLQVAKCLWAFQKNEAAETESLEKNVQLLQLMYQEGSRAYEEEEAAKAEIDELNIKIYKNDPSIKALYDKTRSWSVEYYAQFEKRIGVSFDRYYYESEVQEEGKKLVLENTPKIFKKSEGAHIFPGSKYGLHDRVFVTSKMTPTYEAKDLYLENLKMDEWPADLLVISTASEQNEYFKVLFKALETLDPKRFVGKLKHVGFGMVQLKQGKLSSRKGSIIGGIELVDAVVERASELSEGDTTISEVVGIGAVKYSFLSSSPEKNVVFDINQSISIQGNSGPYLQYTVARAKSILVKAGSSKTGKFEAQEVSKEEEALLRSFVHFPQVVADAAVSYAPNLLCNYLFGLAQKFNGFYNAHKIVGGENEEFKLALTAATGQILETGLHLLGIKAPEKM